MPAEAFVALCLQDFEGFTEPLFLDTSETESTHLLVGRDGTHIRISPSTYRLLRAVETGHSFDDLARALSRRSNRPVTAGEVETAYGQVVEQIVRIQDKTEPERHGPGFWLRTPLLPARWVQRVATLLAPAFARGPAILLLGFIVLGLVVGLADGLQLDFSGRDLWLGYGLFFVSLIAHELGHASACARFGAAPADIGFTLYLVYPALYSDVSAAWRLPRFQRVVVDLGGSYFQLVLGALYALAFVVTQWPPWAAAFALIIVGNLFSLNPVFRFDGYWVLADALGVTNLGSQPGRILRHVRDRLLHRAAAPLPWSPGVVTLLAIYTPLVLVVWGLFLVQLVPLAGRQLIAYPGRWSRLLATGEGVSDLLASTFFLIAVCYIAWKIFQKFIAIPGLRLARKLSGRPR